MSAVSEKAMAVESMRKLDVVGVCVSALLLLSPTVWAGSEEHEPPKMSPQATPVEFDTEYFSADPDYQDKPYNIEDQLAIYGGKRPVENPRPMLELGRAIYDAGPLGTSGHGFGDKNPTDQAFAVYGDWRTAIAWNDNGAAENGVIATRLNLDVDWKLTGTERIHAFFRPLDTNGQFTRCELAGNPPNSCQLEADLTAETLFFEGDLGQITSGLSGEYQDFDLPFAIGKMPLLFQNGVWMEDVVTGIAVTVPAMNSPSLDISNMDVTAFAFLDNVSNAGVLEANGLVAQHSVNVYGATAFIDAGRGYWELGYGYVDAQGRLSDQSYHNLGVAFTKRYGGRLSNSVRLIHSFGQDRNPGNRQNADGTVVLIENSLITSQPSVSVPYLNLFVGFDRPQSLARDAGAGGILKNTGINFETDGLTGFPTLDASANNTWGGALGYQYLFDLDQQIVVELATVQELGDATNRGIAGPQTALGMRYQKPLSRAWIFRADAMVADRQGAEDLSAVRFELRRKF